MRLFQVKRLIIIDSRGTCFTHTFLVTRTDCNLSQLPANLLKKNATLLFVKYNNNNININWFIGDTSPRLRSIGHPM